MLSSLPGYPKVEAQAWPPPQARAAYFRKILFHRLYLDQDLKVIVITFPWPLTYFPRIQLTIKQIKNKHSIICTIYFIIKN